MTKLIVQLPPRDPAVQSQEWRLPPMPFMLLDKRGRTLRAGRATVAMLPRATGTVLLVAARDVLMLGATLPPLKGPRLRQALPNVIEDQLIQDAQTCHIAVDPTPLAALAPLVAAPAAAASAAALRRRRAAAAAQVQPTAAAAQRRLVAVIDRGWFRFIHEAFVEAGHRGLRAVPITRCLPAPLPAFSAADALAQSAAEAAAALAASPAAEPIGGLEPIAGALPGAVDSAAAAEVAAGVPAIALILGAVVPTDVPLPGDLAVATPQARVEVAIARGPFGEGLAIPAPALEATLTAMMPGSGSELYRLTAIPGDDSMRRAPTLPSGAAAAPLPHDEHDPQARAAAAAEAAIGALQASGHLALTPLPFETLARNALSCRFDLCQFEFAPQPLRMRRGTLKYARLPVALALATLLVAIIGINVQWAMLAHQRDALTTRMTELLLSTFPRTTAVLDPPTQMTRQIDALRTAAGELSPADFLTLADGLARSLGPIPANGVSALDYQKRELEVRFKPGVKVDDSLTQRLARNGLAGTFDGSRWTIRSMQ